MLVILAIFVVVAGLQWFIIKRIPYRIARVLIQTPLLVITILITGYFLVRANAENEIAQAQQIQDSIVDSYIVRTGSLRVEVSATGSITPIRQVPLAFSLASAPVEMLNVEQGDTVTEGQVLAELLNTDFQQAVDDATLLVQAQTIAFNAIANPASPEQIAVIQAQLDAANAQLLAAYSTGSTFEQREIARLQSEIARNQLWQLQLDRDNVVNNPPDPIVIPTGDLPDPIDDTIDSIASGINADTQAQFDATVRQVESIVEQGEFGVAIADANVESTQQQYADPGSVAAANAAVIQAEIALDQALNGAPELVVEQAATDLASAELSLELAQANLQQTQLIAPFDGIIAQNNLTIGEFPPQGISLLLIDDSSFYVDLPVDETDITSIAVGQMVTFEVDALPDEIITGVITSVGFAPIDTGGADTGLVAYNIRVTVDATTAPIRSGMTVTGNILTLDREDVLLIENSFIRINRATGEAFVTVRTEDGNFEERAIIIGDNNALLSEVISGLEIGEEVILLPRTEETEFGG